MLLIHTCCADCLLKLIHSLPKSFTDYEILFYNPNIHPRTEKDARLNAIKQLYPNKKIIVPDYRPSEYFDAIRGWKNQAQRCTKCWQLRLDFTYKYAKEHGFDAITSTLLSSHYQNHAQIVKFLKEYDIKTYIPKQEDCECKTHGFYKQNFCGCVYSLLDKLNENYNAKE